MSKQQQAKQQVQRQVKLRAQQQVMQQAKQQAQLWAKIQVGVKQLVQKVIQLELFGGQPPNLSYHFRCLKEYQWELVRGQVEELVQVWVMVPPQVKEQVQG